MKGLEPILKVMRRADGRSMYMYFPKGVARALLRRSALVVLRDDESLASVQKLLGSGGLAALSEERQVILAFPNPLGSAWNWTLDPAEPDDLAFLVHIQAELDSPVENEPFSMARAASSNPLADKFFYTLWHPMADVRYLAGFGTGASMACAFAAIHPQFVTALYAEVGELSPAALAKATNAPVPACLADCPDETTAYFVHANGATQADAEGHVNPVNPAQRVTLAPQGKANPLPYVYDALFRQVRRPNTSLYGDVERRILPESDDGFTLYEEDDRLSDGVKHTWLVHVPKSVRAHPDIRVPLMLFFHGASDNPVEAADMTKFHELGEREHFITVYPWGTNLMTWNSSMLPDEPDDDAFVIALIDDMVKRYPVDAERVYLSGFSNGAGEAQTVALCHPDRIAAICPIDANWPGNRMGENNLTYQDVAPMRIGMEKKAVFDYRMPVWYTYGGREVSYPVYNRCTQQIQYDYWKLYNHIPIIPTPGKDNPHPCGCGVPGDQYERLTPSQAHTEHAYDVHRFFSGEDARLNLYNYVVMLTKGHEIAPMDAELSWRYVSRFRRLPDGSLGNA